MESEKSKKKYIIGAIIIILLIIIGFLMSNFISKNYFNNKEFDPKKTLEYHQQVIEQYEKDLKGGMTPEDTLKLYTKALHNNDLKEASEYFLIEDQKEELAELKSLDNVQLNAWIKNIESVKKINQDENFARFEYEIEKLEEIKIEGIDAVLPPGKYKSSITIRKIPSGVWKLER